jgi:hypothetical protein
MALAQHSRTQAANGLEQRFHASYRRHLLSNPDRARAEFESMVRALAAGHALYGGKVLRTFLHPYVLGRPAIEAMARVAEALTELLEKVARLYLEQPGVRRQFPIDPRIESLILEAGRQPRSVPILRFDSFFDGRRFRILEVNTDSSSGMNDTNEIEARFLELPLVKEFACRFPLTLMPMLEPLRQTLLDLFRSSGRRPHSPDGPVVAIVDWPGVKTEAEFFALQEHFESAGTRTFLVDPRDLRLEGERLMAGGTAVDLVYKRVLTSELLERWDQVQPLIEGYRRGLFCQAGPYLGEVSYDKGVLAFLSDPANAAFFSAGERELIERHIPWSRRLRPGKTSWQGRQADLFELLRRESDSFIIKPATSYGGVGVKLGRECPAEDWGAALDAWEQAPMIAQEFVDIPTEEFVQVESGTVSAKKINLGQFVFSGRFAGLYCRVSDDSIINVSAGGATLPCFVVDQV